MMKQILKVATPLIIGIGLVNCGDNNNNSQPTPVAPYGANSCQGTCGDPSQVQTSMGCLPQGSCAPCMGSYNGTCVQGVAGSFPGSYGSLGTPGTYNYGYPGYNNYPSFGPRPYYYPGSNWYFYYYH